MSNEEPFWIRYGQVFTYLDIKDKMFPMGLREKPTELLIELFEENHIGCGDMIQRVLEERGFQLIEDENGSRFEKAELFRNELD